MKGREVFRDCEYAKKRLQQAIEQENLEDARVFWFAALVMLRAIGHVLHKVDAKKRGLSFQRVLKDRFAQWKQDPVFANFIELERNNILKEYESNLLEEATTEESHLLLESGDKLLAESGDPFVIGTATVTTLVMGRGVYSGRSPVDALAEALAWWDKELSELEQL